MLEKLVNNGQPPVDLFVSTETSGKLEMIGTSIGHAVLFFVFGALIVMAMIHVLSNIPNYYKVWNDLFNEPAKGDFTEKED